MQDARTFKGGLAEQVQDALAYLDNLSGTLVRKNADRPEASAWQRFPGDAVREALVNAVCNRSYREDAPDPIKVNVFPDRMVIASYPGPVPGIRRRHFAAGAEPPEVTPRNRRIAEFLKELRLAELRLSGIPKMFRAMEANGSPLPEFDFDEDRTYFQVTLRAHPIHAAVSALRDIAELRAIGQTEEAERRLETAWATNRGSAALAIEMVMLHANRGSLLDAEAVFEAFAGAADPSQTPRVANVLADLARAAHRSGGRSVNRRLLEETETLLRRVLRLDTHPVRHAWAWHEMARTLEWLGRPADEVAAAYRRAIDLAPREDRFRAALRDYEQRAGV